MQAARAVGPDWGRGLAGVGLLAQQGEGSRHGQAGPGRTRFLGTEETMTTSCRSPKGQKSLLEPPPGSCLGLAWVAPRLHLSRCPLNKASQVPRCGQTPIPKLSRDTVFRQVSQTFGSDCLGPGPVSMPQGLLPPCLPSSPSCPAATPGSLLRQEIGFTFHWSVPAQEGHTKSEECPCGLALLCHSPHPGCHLAPGTLPT